MIKNTTDPERGEELRCMWITVVVRGIEVGVAGDWTSRGEEKWNDGCKHEIQLYVVYKKPTFNIKVAVSYKTKYILTMQSSDCALWYLPEVHTNHPHMEVCSSSSRRHNCQNLEATKTSFSG